MTTKRLIAKLRISWRQFARAKGGNTLVVFALAFIPILGLTGAAVDYSHASLIRTSMQSAGDTAALAISQSAASANSTDLQTAGDNYYRALFKRTDVHDLNVTATYSNTNGSTVVITATAIYDTSIMGVMGQQFRHLPISITSTASWGTTRLRVALVLDNTGSMAQSGKLTALINATTSTDPASPGLLTQLQNAATIPGDVYVSIIPFAKDVNVDPVNYSAPWIYWDDAAHTDTKSWDANNGSCSVGHSSTRQGCLATSGGTCSISGITDQNSCTSAGTCSNATYTTQNSCTGAGTCSISGYTTQNSCNAATGSCSIAGFTSQNSCTSAGSCNNTRDTTRNACVGDGYCSDPSHHGQNGCQNAGATWRTPAIWSAGVWTAHSGIWTPQPNVWTAGVWSPPTWTPDNHNTWNGCVMDRGDPGAPNAGNYDQNVVAPTTDTPATLFAAEQYSNCTQAAMGLSYSWTAMTTEVNHMVANGSTNQGIGLALGWMSLAGGGPFTAPPMDARYTYKQVIILLTDGLNTQNRWYGDGVHTASQVDTRQQVTCDNIKRAGISIYTIQVNTQTPADPTSTLLQGCAGSTPGQADPSMFFMLTASGQIAAVFKQIGTQLTKLHIAR
jgi:Flp pilus assembly protein TadG